MIEQEPKYPHERVMPKKKWPHQEALEGDGKETDYPCRHCSLVANRRRKERAEFDYSEFVDISTDKLVGS